MLKAYLGAKLRKGMCFVSGISHSNLNDGPGRQAETELLILNDVVTRDVRACSSSQARVVSSIRLDGLVGGSAVGGDSRVTVRDTVGTVDTSGTLLTLVVEVVLLVVVVDVKAHTGGVDVAVTEDEHGAEDGLREQVQDSVKDSLTVAADDVAALAETPGDWVQEPEEGGERTAHEEGSSNVAAESRSVATGLPDELVDDVEESEAGKDEVSPLVRRLDECTNKTSDDHDLVDKNHEEDGWPWHAGGEEQVEKQERSGDEPVDVTDVEDLAVDASNDTAANEFDIDWSPSEVGAHGEIGDGSDHGDTSGDVVEDTVLTRLGQRKADEGEGSHSHDCAHSPVPVRAVGGDCSDSSLAVLGVGYRVSVCNLIKFITQEERTVHVERVIAGQGAAGHGGDEECVHGGCVCSRDDVCVRKLVKGTESPIAGR